MIGKTAYVVLGEFFVKLSDLMRYVLWGAVAATAEANQREYHMTTTWFPHFFGNTISLFLPDALRLLSSKSHEFSSNHSTVLADIERVLDTAIGDNPTYAVYVAPIAIGYI